MSIAQIAANIKQRQKIAHAASYTRRLEDARKDTISAEISRKKQRCVCGFEAYYAWKRCPSCGGN